MKKFLVSIFICVGIISYACAMEQLPVQAEQPADALSYLVINKPNEIVGFLDLESLCSLSQTCQLYKEICDAVPSKYLSFDFCDAAELQNKKLIERFIKQPDWLFESGIGQEVFVEHNDDGSKVVKIFKQTLNAGVERYLAHSSFCYVSEGDKVDLYFCIYQTFFEIDDENKRTTKHVFWVSPSCFSESVGIILKKYLEIVCGDIKHSLDRALVSNESGYINNRLNGYNYQGGQEKLFELSSPDCSVNNFIKEFGMFLIWLLSAQKNNATVIRCIFDKSPVQEYWWSSFFSNVLSRQAEQIVEKIVASRLSSYEY